ncbi:unnamed protein product [Rhodiola kirilowii]
MNGTLLAPLSSANSLFFSPATQIPANNSTSHVSYSNRTSIRSSVQTYPETPTRKSNASSLYDVLQVSRNATPVQIKLAYRTLAKTYHPDAAACSQSSDGQDFIEINKAYSTLFDPTSRALYDMKLGFGRSGSGRVGVERSGYCSGVRRWETDQCW